MYRIDFENSLDLREQSVQQPKVLARNSNHGRGDFRRLTPTWEPTWQTTRWSLKVKKLAPVPEPIQRTLREFFVQSEFSRNPFRGAGGTSPCVITGDKSSTWHHLDDNHDNHGLSNIIPLASNLNCHLGGLKTAQHRDILWIYPNLLPAALANRADLNFRNWEVSSAYGCARLAYFMGGPSYAALPPIERLSILRGSLFYARHRFNQEIVQNIVLEEFVPAIYREAATLGYTTKNLILQEICALLGEDGQSMLAANLSETLKTNPEMTALQKAGFLRRVAKSRRIAGESARQVKPLFEESTDLSGRDFNEHVGRIIIEGQLACVESDYLSEDIKIAYEATKMIYTGLVKRAGQGPTAMSVANAATVTVNHVLLMCLVRPSQWRERVSAGLEEADYLLQLSGAGLSPLRSRYWEDVLKRIDITHTGIPHPTLLVDKFQRRPLNSQTILALVRAAEILLR